MKVKGGNTKEIISGRLIYLQFQSPDQDETDAGVAAAVGGGVGGRRGRPEGLPVGRPVLVQHVGRQRQGRPHQPHQQERRDAHVRHDGVMYVGLV